MAERANIIAREAGTNLWFPRRADEHGQVDASADRDVSCNQPGQSIRQHPRPPHHHCTALIQHSDCESRPGGNRKGRCSAALA